MCYFKSSVGIISTNFNLKLLVVPLILPGPLTMVKACLGKHPGGVEDKEYKDALMYYLGLLVLSNNLISTVILPIKSLVLSNIALTNFLYKRCLTTPDGTPANSLKIGKAEGF